MTDRKKNRGKKFDEDEPPTKEEYAVAKFLRFNVPTREGKLHNMEVHCFFASAAVDALMKSKWSSAKNTKDPLFYNRSTCVFYCQRLMQKGLFHRAERVQRKKDKDKGDNKDKGDKSKKKKGKESAAAEKEETGGDELRERKSKKDKKGKKEKDDPTSAGDKTAQSTEKDEGEKKEEKAEEKEKEKKEEKKEEGKKKKEKRLKLVMTDDQRFLDGDENIYVWIYDPANAKTLVIGSLIVLGAIALCLFPLWPEVVRLGVYYLSLAAAGFVGFILALVVIRLVLFCLVWVLTLGRHHFWLLPNLTEDVGFFDSFRPLYQHDSVTKDAPTSSSKDKSKSSSSSSSKSSSNKNTTTSSSSLPPIEDTQQQTGEGPEEKSFSETSRKKAEEEEEKRKEDDKEESSSEHSEGFEVIERGEVEGEGGGDDEDDDDDDDDKDQKDSQEEEEEEEGEEEDQNGAEEEEEEDTSTKKDK